MVTVVIKDSLGESMPEERPGAAPSGGRTESDFNVVWPSISSEILPIIDLEIFPLKYDRSGTQKRLQARGQVLWNCRKRGYMTYTALTGKSEIHTVSIYISHNIYACIDTDWNRYLRDT